MKKILTCLCMTTIVFCAGAQPEKKQDRFAWGIKAGFNSSNLHATPAKPGNSYKALTRIGGAVFMTIPVSHSFAVQPEMIYNPAGSSYSATGFININTKVSIDYLSIPILAKVMSRDNSFGVYAGPQLSLLTGAKIKYENETEDIKESFKGTDFAVVAGIGYTFSAGLHLDMRYQLGLSNILKDPDTGESMKNRSFSVTIGWLFASGRK